VNGHAKEQSYLVLENSFIPHLQHVSKTAGRTVKDACKYIFFPARETGELERTIKENLMVITDKTILLEF